MVTSLESLNLEDAKSEELRAAFHCVADSSAPDGGPRYGRDVCRYLQRIIVCRSYAKATLELSYFLAALAQLNVSYLDMIWGVERASASAFRAAISKAVPDTSKSPQVYRQGIRFHAETGVFDISYSRMPVLAAFIDFLASAIGFADVDAFAERAASVAGSEEQVVAIAKDVQKSLYRYLREHLPPAQKQRRERHFLSYVSEGAGQDADVASIDDEAVFDYWRAFASDPSKDTRTFRSVYQTARQLITALTAASERIAGERAATIGLDFEAGEVDPEDVEYILATVDEEEERINRIRELSGDRVKFMSNVEAQSLFEIPDNERVIAQLPKSVLRNAEYGSLQLRFGARVRAGESDLRSLLPSPTEPVYREKLAAYEKHVERLRKLCIASVYVLHKHRDAKAITTALHLAPDLDWGALARDEAQDRSENVVSIVELTASAEFFLAHPDDRASELGSFLADARKIYRRTNRQGFKDPGDREAVTAIADVIADVLSLQDHVRMSLEKHLRPLDWPAIEVKDAAGFGEVFERLYLSSEDGEGSRNG